MTVRSISKAPKTSSYDKLSPRQKALIVIVVIAFLIGGLYFSYLQVRSLISSWIGPSTIPTDRIGNASMLIMQIDSFLAAGFIIGFFQFQGLVTKMIQRISELNLTKEINRPEQAKELGWWGNEKRLSFFANGRYAIIMSSLLLYVLSGLYSIRALLFQTEDDLVTSLSLLVWGVILMVLLWYGNIVLTEKMAQKIGQNKRRPEA